MKRAWNVVCLLAALCGLTAMGLAEPLAAANPEGAGAENAHCPYLVRMREGCFRGDAAVATASDLDPVVEQELPYVPAPLLGPLWGADDAAPAGSGAEMPIDHEWEVYRRWIEGRWYHDAAWLPEEDSSLLSLVPQLDVEQLDVEQLLRSVVAAVRSFAAPAPRVANVSDAIALAAGREEGIAARIQRAADQAAAMNRTIPAIAEPHDIYASRYYPGEQYYPGEEPAADRWYDDEAGYDSGWYAEGVGEEYDSYGDAIEGELGGLDDDVWGRVQEFGDDPAEMPWDAPADDAGYEPSDEPAADGIPYEMPEGYDFSGSDFLHRLRGHLTWLFDGRELSVGEIVLGASPLVPEDARGMTPAVAVPAEGYAAEYVPEYEAPSEDRFWSEGSFEADDEGAESVIPYRDEDDDLPADPESGESWDASPLESALHYEVRPMTGRAVVDQGAVLAVPLARIEACQVWIAELLGSAPVLHAQSELSAAYLSVSATLPALPRPRLSLLRTSPERPVQPVSLNLPSPRRLLAGPAVVLEQIGTALHGISAHLTQVARGGEELPPGAQRNLGDSRR